MSKQSNKQSRKKADIRRERERRKKMLLGLAAALIVVAVVVVIVTRDGAPPPQAVEVRDWHDLHAMRDNPGERYVLMNDLDPTVAGYAELAGAGANGGRGWQPVGTHSVPFTGRLTGEGYEIRGLFIDRPTGNGVGLIGVLGPGGVVDDVRLVDAEVTGGGAVGALVGYNSEGTVNNSASSGSVTGNSAAGGLVGENRGTVRDSFSSGEVTGETMAGGLVGYNDWGAIVDSYSTSSVSGRAALGGLVGRNTSESMVSNSHYSYEEALINGERVITIGALPGDDFAEWLAGDRSLDVSERLSSEDGYQLIHTVGDLRQLLAFGQDASLKFRLMADLDLGDEPGLFIPYLAGEFDGNGHSIANLRLDTEVVDQVGLFGYLALGGKITDLGIESASVSGGWFAGGLVGYNWGGTVDRSYALGTVSGGWHVGGLGGYSAGIVDRSYFAGEVDGEAAVGGLVGTSDGAVNRSYSDGSVTATAMHAGGLIGWNSEGAVTDSYSSASVTCDQMVGGLIGSNMGPVESTYSVGRVTGDIALGGLVGADPFEAVEYSFWDRETAGTDLGEAGVGVPTAMLQQLSTFEAARWDIVAVAPGQANPAYIWNIVDGETYPFLSWQGA